MTPEGKTKKQFNEYLDNHDRIELWHVTLQDRFTSGLPDKIGVYCGVFWAVELKAPGKKPNAMQRVVLAAINMAGGVADYADNIDDAVAIVERAKCKALGLRFAKN